MSPVLREQLVDQLTGQNAHISFEHAVSGLTVGDVGKRTGEIPYSIWEQVEHVRIAQSDIVEFCINPEYEAPGWPEEYWPPNPEPEGKSEWDRSLKTIRTDLQRMVDMVNDPDRNLFEPFPWGDGQTLFREVLLVIDHNSYHTGQIVTIRRSLGLWE